MVPFRSELWGAALFSISRGTCRGAAHFQTVDFETEMPLRIGIPFGVYVAFANALDDDGIGKRCAIVHYYFS